MYDEEVQVLIAGGGLVGLSLAVFLRDQGISTIVLERHPATSMQPRGRMLTSRSMELFHSIGLGQAIVEAPPSVFLEYGESARAETLVGAEDFRTARPPMDSVAEFSPHEPALIDQSTVVSLLRTRAEQCGADIRFGHRMAGFYQRGRGVDVVAEERAAGRRYRVRAEYLVAADGHRSPTRRSLGIEMLGPGTLQHIANIAFEADLTVALRGRRLALCYLRQPRSGTLLAILDRSDRWVLMVPYDPETSDVDREFDRAGCVDMIRAATGIADLEPALLMPFADEARLVHTWEMAAAVAERYRVGRVLLAGDAAHIMPPAGGFGGNTGIQDAHNLAWKIAAVLGGAADPGLLETYELERRPVARLTCEHTIQRLRGRTEAEGDSQLAANSPAIGLGYRYRSPAILAEDDDGPDVLHPRDLSGLPGTRAAHLELVRDGRQLSTIDLFGHRFVLLTGPEAVAWSAAGRRFAAESGIGLDVYRLGHDVHDSQRRWKQKYGVDDSGAVLIRPDGFVAWRAPSSAEQPERLLADVFRRLLTGVGDSDAT